MVRLMCSKDWAKVYKQLAGSNVFVDIRLKNAKTVMDFVFMLLDKGGHAVLQLDEIHAQHLTCRERLLPPLVEFGLARVVAH